MIVTAIELRKRLHGFGGRASREVRRAVAMWLIVVLIWSGLFGLYVASRQVIDGAAVGVTASALSVVLIGLWYLVVASARGVAGAVGVGLAAVGMAGLVLAVPEVGMFVIWVGASVVFLAGALVAQFQLAQARKVQLATNG